MLLVCKIHFTILMLLFWVKFINKHWDLNCWLFVSGSHIGSDFPLSWFPQWWGQRLHIPQNESNYLIIYSLKSMRCCWTLLLICLKREFSDSGAAGCTLKTLLNGIIISTGWSIWVTKTLIPKTSFSIKMVCYKCRTSPFGDKLVLRFMPWCKIVVAPVC